MLDWPANSSTPDRKTVWCPEPTAPNSTAKTTSWDFSAMDIKILNLQVSLSVCLSVSVSLSLCV